jgi:hypothetical protein
MCPMSDVITDFDTRLDGGGFGESRVYGPVHPTENQPSYQKAY